MSTRTALVGGITLACLSCGAAAVTVPDPTFRGTVVEDFTQPYVFDGMTGTPRDPAPGEEPRVVPNAFRGTVNMKVIHDTDGTYDFYFRVTTGIGDTGFRAPIEDFFYSARQVPTSLTVAHHTYSVLPGFENGDIRPSVGETFPPSNDAWFHWSSEADLFGFGILEEAVFLLDTDARAYAKTGQFRIDASTRDFSMGSVPYDAFGPAIPEPTTYALMLGGVALLALVRRRRPRRGSRHARIAAGFSQILSGNSMKVFRVATAALLTSVVGPLSAQVLHFEGAFTEAMFCPRGACDGPQPMEPLPFSFDVELKFNPSGPNHESFTTRDSSGWPRLSFSPAIEQTLFLIPASEPRVEGTYQFSRTQVTRHSTAEGFSWNFEASEGWNEPIGEDATRSETRLVRIELFRSGGVSFEQASRPLSRDEMLGFLQDLVGKQHTLSATNALEIVRDHDITHGHSNVFGQFRLVSMCPAPTGLRKWLG